MSPNMQPNLVLGGFMGTGKSTVGALIAQRLARGFYDTDTIVEREAGMSIREIFATAGEPAFRSLEREACKHAARQNSSVVSVGGGALLDPDSRSALEQSGIVVLLTCERDVLIERLRESAQRGERPLLGEDFAARIGELLKTRAPVYASFSLQVDTTHLTPEEASNRVVDLYVQAAQERMAACTL